MSRPVCIVTGENHSSDLVEVYHGHTEPAVACGYHATYHPQLVFLAHFAQMSTAQRADLESAS